MFVTFFSKTEKFKMKKKKQIYVHSSRNDIVLPPVYRVSYRPSSLGTSRDVNSLRMSHNKTNLMLRKKKPTYVTQGDIEKDSILQWLEDENAPPAKVLERLSETSSEYAKLYKKAADELNVRFYKGKEPKLIDLEAKTSFQSANLEVELQQERTKQAEAKEENQKLHKLIETKRKELEQINFVVSMCNKLYKELHIIKKEEVANEKHDEQKKVYYSMVNDKVYNIDMDLYKEDIQKRMKHEEEEEDLYQIPEEEEDNAQMQNYIEFEKENLMTQIKHLQMEGEILGNNIQELETRLRKVQEKQILLIREKAKSMNPSLP